MLEIAGGVFNKDSETISSKEFFDEIETKFPDLAELALNEFIRVLSDTKTKIIDEKELSSKFITLKTDCQTFLDQSLPSEGDKMSFVGNEFKNIFNKFQTYFSQNVDLETNENLDFIGFQGNFCRDLIQKTNQEEQILSVGKEMAKYYLNIAIDYEMEKKQNPDKAKIELKNKIIGFPGRELDFNACLAGAGNKIKSQYITADDPIYITALQEYRNSFASRHQSEIYAGNREHLTTTILSIHHPVNSDVAKIDPSHLIPRKQLNLRDVLDYLHKFNANFDELLDSKINAFEDEFNQIKLKDFSDGCKEIQDFFNKVNKSLGFGDDILSVSSDTGISIGNYIDSVELKFDKNIDFEDFKKDIKKQIFQKLIIDNQVNKLRPPSHIFHDFPSPDKFFVDGKDYLDVNKIDNLLDLFSNHSDLKKVETGLRILSLIADNFYRANLGYLEVFFDKFETKYSKKFEEFSFENSTISNPENNQDRVQILLKLKSDILNKYKSKQSREYGNDESTKLQIKEFYKKIFLLGTESDISDKDASLFEFPFKDRLSHQKNYLHLAIENGQNNILRNYAKNNQKFNQNLIYLDSIALTREFSYNEIYFENLLLYAVYHRNYEAVEIIAKNRKLFFENDEEFLKTLNLISGNKWKEVDVVKKIIDILEQESPEKATIIENRARVQLLEHAINYKNEELVSQLVNKFKTRNQNCKDIRNLFREESSYTLSSKIFGGKTPKNQQNDIVKIIVKNSRIDVLEKLFEIFPESQNIIKLDHYRFLRRDTQKLNNLLKLDFKKSFPRVCDLNMNDLKTFKSKLDIVLSRNKCTSYDDKKKSILEILDLIDGGPIELKKYLFLPNKFSSIIFDNSLEKKLKAIYPDENSDVRRKFNEIKNKIIEDEKTTDPQRPSEAINKATCMNFCFGQNRR